MADTLDDIQERLLHCLGHSPQLHEWTWTHGVHGVVREAVCERCALTVVCWVEANPPARGSKGRRKS